MQDSDGLITLWDVANNPDAPLSLLLPDDCCNTLTVSQSGWLAAVSVDSTKIYVSRQEHNTSYINRQIRRQMI